MTIDDIVKCAHKKALEVQLYHKAKYKLDINSVRGYVEAGCYRCDGYQEKCGYYTIMEDKND